jgi:hypothetical protein
MAKEYGRCFFKCNNGAKTYIDPKEKNFKNSKKKNDNYTKQINNFKITLHD